MSPADSNVLKLAPDPGTPAYRSAPHNIEAEQSLLGAILVNNDAFYRVSDFLEPRHFFEPIHQTIFETAGSLIRMGKVATPVTLKTFLPAETDIGGMTVGQYLARLAAEATTIINAQDYGRTIYELALRRDLIRIGEDMVNVAFDAPVDFAPRAQIEDAERRLYELAESGRYDGGFQRFAQALTVAVDMAAKAFQRDGKLSGIASGLRDLDTKMGGLQPSDLIIVAGRPGMGKTALATNIAYNVAKAHRAEVQADGTMKSVNGGIVGFFSCEMSAEQLATRILAEQTSIASSTIRRGGITETDFEKIRDYSIELQSLGIAQSMGSRGDCFDNAVAESFFATLKKELIHRRSWPTKAELRSEVFDYIEAFYNRRRRHSTLGMLSPVDFENRTLGPDGSESRRFAARIHTQDQVHYPNRRPRRLTKPCPPNRGNSSPTRLDAVAGHR